MIIGISKEYLESKINELYECADRGNDAINGLSAGANIAILKALSNECKELSPWLAIDEFKNSGFVGLCWILTKDGDVFAHNFDGEYFINPYMPNYPIHEETVRSVMPIKTPEAPK